MCYKTEDKGLAMMAKDRLEQTNSERISQKEVDKYFGITETDLEGFDEIEFE